MYNMLNNCADELNKAIRKYCRARVNANVCTADVCEFCPVNSTYSMAQDDEVRTEDDDI